LIFHGFRNAKNHFINDSFFNIYKSFILSSVLFAKSKKNTQFIYFNNQNFQRTAAAPNISLFLPISYQEAIYEKFDLW